VRHSGRVSRTDPADVTGTIDRSLGTALRAARGRAGLTAQVLAARAGISQPHLSQMENGKVSPSIATLYRLASALGVSPQELLPDARTDDVVIARAGDGEGTPIEDRPDAALARVLVGSPGRLLQVQEVTIAPGQGAGGWFEHAGEEFLYVLEGAIVLEVGNAAPEHLGRGDAAWYASQRPHRWTVVDGEGARILAVSGLPTPTPLVHG
jgi:transcriptional regulator with XRE-family HTH domain